MRRQCERKENTETKRANTEGEMSPKLSIDNKDRESISEFPLTKSFKTENIKEKEILSIDTENSTEPSKSDSFEDSNERSSTSEVVLATYSSMNSKFSIESKNRELTSELTSELGSKEYHQTEGVKEREGPPEKTESMVSTDENITQLYLHGTESMVNSELSEVLAEDKYLSFQTTCPSTSTSTSTRSTRRSNLTSEQTSKEHHLTKDVREKEKPPKETENRAPTSENITQPYLEDIDSTLRPELSDILAKDRHLSLQVTSTCPSTCTRSSRRSSVRRERVLMQRDKYNAIRNRRQHQENKILEASNIIREKNEMKETQIKNIRKQDDIDEKPEVKPIIRQIEKNNAHKIMRAIWHSREKKLSEIVDESRQPFEMETSEVKSAGKQEDGIRVPEMKQVREKIDEIKSYVITNYIEELEKIVMPTGETIPVLEEQEKWKVDNENEFEEIIGNECSLFLDDITDALHTLINTNRFGNGVRSPLKN